MEKYKINYYNNYIILLLIILLFPSQIYAQREIILSDNVNEYKIGKYTDILFDTSKTLTINDVVFGEAANNFKSLNSDQTNLGYRKEAIWLKMNVKNMATENNSWLINLNYDAFDNVLLYVPIGDKKYLIKKAGLMYSMKEREIKHHLILFPIFLKYGDSKTYFIRVESGKSVPLQLEIDIPSEFFKLEQEGNLIIGIIYGGIVVLAIYNLFLFFSVKDLSYFFYSLYAVSICYYQACVDGLGYQFLTPSWPEFNLIYGNVAVSLLVLFGSLFAREFMQLRKYSPLLDKIFWGIIIFSFSYLLFVSIFQIKLTILTSYIGLAYILLIVISCIYCISKQSRNAFYYLIATTFFVAGVVFRAFKNIGILDISFFTDYGMQTGMLIEMTILSFALGNRINTIKQEEEKEKALIRSRIASDLHDEIGSNLSSISLSSQLIRNNQFIGEKERGQLEDITITAKETADSIRDIIWFINPEHYRDEDLIMKMKDTASKILVGIEFTFNNNGNKNIDIKNLQVRRNLFLIYKEVLNNIVKHSYAESVVIILEDKPGFLNIKITDDGIGYNKDEITYGEGLKNIQKRISDINGRLEIKSQPGKGTSILFSIKK